MRSLAAKLVPIVASALAVAATGARGAASATGSEREGSMRDAVQDARAAYEQGRAGKDSDARREWFSMGMRLAQARLDNTPDDPEGLFWLAVNMGAEALERGKMAALPVVPRMEKLLLRLDAVAPRYEDAGAARVLGRLYHQAPAVISVGSNDKARKFLLRALTLAPEHPGNLAFAADFLLDVDGEKARARELAERCLARLDAFPGAGGARAREGHDVREWRRLATEVLKETR